MINEVEQVESKFLRERNDFAHLHTCTFAQNSSSVKVE